MSVYDGYSRFYTGAVDDEGHLTDTAVSFIERMYGHGHVWRLGDGYATLSNTGDKAFLTFTTPATGTTLYTFATLNKSGGELVFTLNEGGAVTGGTAITPRNMDRVTGDSSPPFTATKFGLSASGMSITGGIDFPNNMIPGSNNPSSRPGGTASGAAFIKCKPSTTYTLVLEAKSALTLTALVDIIHTELTI